MLVNDFSGVVWSLCVVADLIFLITSRLWRDKCKEFDVEDMESLVKSPAKRKTLVPVTKNPWKQACVLVVLLFFSCDLATACMYHTHVMYPSMLVRDIYLWHNVYS